MTGATCLIIQHQVLLVEALFTLPKLGRMHQYLGHDLNVYLKRLYEKALHCCDSVVEEVLVDVCHHCML